LSVFRTITPDITHLLALLTGGGELDGCLPRCRSR
jgi:hypothetical protein